MRYSKGRGTFVLSVKNQQRQVGITPTTNMFLSIKNSLRKKERSWFEDYYAMSVITGFSHEELLQENLEMRQIILSVLKKG